MERRALLPIILLLLAGFPLRFGVAVPAAPSPTCGITAIVLSVNLTTNFYGFDYYSVGLDVLEIWTDHPVGNLTCENLDYDIEENWSAILSISDFNNVPISSGQNIRANIQFSGDEWFHGYFLSNLHILDYDVWLILIPIVAIGITFTSMIWKKKHNKRRQ